MRYFDNGNRVNQDVCALEARNRENQSLTDYKTYNFYNADGTCEELEKKLRTFSSDYPNLTFRVGYGVASACTIEEDNKVRYVNPTHGRERQTLCTRNFVASPALGKGQSVPNLESILINGEDTLTERDCHKIAESQFGVFAPMTQCVENYVKGQAMVVGDEIRIGRPSKDIFLSTRKCT